MRMELKVQQGKIDNRYFSKLCDEIASQNSEIRKNMNLEDDQFYFTEQLTFDTLETYFNLQDKDLKIVNQRREEIHLFSYQKSIERIKFYREDRLFFPYYSSKIWSKISDRGLNKVHQRIENGELSVFD